MVVACGIGVLSYLVLKPPMRALGIAFAGGLVIDPLVAIAAPGCVVLFDRIRTMRRSKAHRSDVREDEILAVELVAAGVSAGVSFDLAVDAAAVYVDGAVASNLVRYLRLVRHGHTPSDSTAVTAEMVRIAHAAESSGAAVAGQLTALADAERSSDEATTNERLARLPVKMLFPLALLILPGFLLVVVAPTVIGGIARLGI